jgi:phytoene dehydrogenase-like protein
MEPFVDRADRLAPFLLGYSPIPRHLVAARFGLLALRSAVGLAKRFDGKRARALFSGLAAHSIQDLHRVPTASFGLVLGLFGHTHGWPLVRGGSQRLANALVSYLRSLGGEIETGWQVKSVDELPKTTVTLLDVTPRQVLRIAGHRLPGRYARALRRYRYGPGVFKIDWALDGPVPWAAEGCARAATLHLGGTLEEIAASENAVWRGEEPERPYVLIAQQSLFDETRAPEGKQTLWGYCHVPNGSSVDMTERIESASRALRARLRHRIWRAFAAQPRSSVTRTHRWRHQRRRPGPPGSPLHAASRPAESILDARLDGLYICSSSTPPGSGDALASAGYPPRGRRSRNSSRPGASAGINFRNGGSVDEKRGPPSSARVSGRRPGR